MTSNDLITILPVIIVTAWGVLLLVADLFIPKDGKSLTAMLAAVGLAAALGFDLALSGHYQTGFNGMAVLDGFAAFANAIILCAGIAGIALAFEFLKRQGIERGEYYPLMLFSTAGMMLLVQSYDLIVSFLAIELLSIPLYIMAGLARPRVDSEESALKYFLLGTFSSGFLLYGIALIYGATSHTGLLGIVAASAALDPTHRLLFLIGAALILVGLGFKLSAVPFHMWAPDVYQGAPTPVSGWMAVTVKVAGLAALLRIFVMAFPGMADKLGPILAALAVLTMIVGNLLALVQTNIKRLLAYSSIANVGYLLMAFVSYADSQVAPDAIAATLFYMVGYAFTSFAAWAVVAAVERGEGKGQQIEDFAGVGRKYPLLGLAMAIAMLSLTGVPPTLGFWGKFYIFRAAVEGGQIGLAVIGLLTSLLSAYYYLRVVVVMYMKTGDAEVSREPWINLLAVTAALGTLVLAFVPGSLLELAERAILKLL